MPRNPHNPSESLPDGPQARIDWPAALAEHEPWLRTVVLARLGGAAGVADVMQQVALAVVRHGAAARDTRPTDPALAAPWLYRVAVTEALLHRRKLGRRRGLLRRYVDVAPAHDANQPDPLDWLLANEQRELVRRALAELPRRDAEVLLLKHTQDWTYRQLAQHLGVSEAAVDGRLQRARGRLRRSLIAADPTLAT